jgi:uncharacterized protein (TIGR02596 family)
MIYFVPSLKPAPRKRQGFTLVELLVVLTIISILTTISAMAFASLMASSHLNEATAIVQGQLELARQTAKTLNRSVQLRFYKDQNNTSSVPSVDSLQIVVPAENSTMETDQPAETDQPVEKPVLLPQSVIIADGSSDLILTALSPSGPSSNPFNPPLPANITNCYVLTFSAAGAITSTDNNGNPVSPSSDDTTVYWSLSLVPQTLYRAKGSVHALQNYATFYINSVNGTSSVTRP